MTQAPPSAAPTPRLRVFVVDDSRVIRRLIVHRLSQEPDLEVVGEAESGTLALERVPALEPEVVTMDVNMPGLDGVSTLRALRARQPDLQIVMFSSVTLHGARISMDALEAGAAEIATKPSAEHGAEPIKEAISDLVQKVRAVGQAARRRRESGGLAPSYTPFLAGPPTPAARRSALHGLELIVLASSTGGPNALVDLFQALPRTLPVPILMVQHMPAFFTQMLAQRLDALGGPRVREAVDGEALVPGTALLAPGDKHLGLVEAPGGPRTRVYDGPRENGCRPAADVLFRDAARVVGGGVLGVVMTGMGQDGALGCEHLRAAGGRVLAQDEETSAVWGMPGAVVRAGFAEAVLPLGALADAIVSRVGRRTALGG